MSDIEYKEGEVERAFADVDKTREHPHSFKVTVLYNGLEREVEAKSDELVKILLAQAIAAFPSVTNQHTLSLFTKDGRELKDEQTVRDAGVKPRETLLLRPGTVKGGGR